MDRKGFTPIIILLIVAAVLIVGGGIWYYEMNKSAPNPAADNLVSTSTSVMATTTTTKSTSSSVSVWPPYHPPVKQIPPPAENLSSSSTAQVGEFTVVAYCSSTKGYEDAAVRRIDILKGTSIVQSIQFSLGAKGTIEPGSESCPGIKSQDINFDGYPDFMIPSDYGSGGESDEYWLFNTSTQQFVDSGGLMNPTFDAASKTVTSVDYLGAGDVDTQTYQAINGELVLIKDVEVGAPDPSNITGPGLTIVKELINGQMQVVSTSTNPLSVTTGTPSCSWLTTTPMPIALFQNSNVAYNGYLYTTGGLAALGGSNGFGLPLLTSNASVYYASINSTGTINSWYNTTSLPSPLNWTSMVAYNGYIYLVGGTTPVTNGSGQSTSTILYAPISTTGSLGAWKETTALPTASFQESAVAYNGYLYVTGGLSSPSSFKSSVLYAAINADGTLGSWMVTTVLPTTLFDHSAVAYNGYLYITGGQIIAGESTSTVLYAPITSNGSLGAWSTTTALPEPVDFHSALISDNYMFVAGAYQNKNLFYAPINSDGALGSWSTSTPEAWGAYTKPVVYNGYIYSNGGLFDTSVDSNVYYDSCNTSRIITGQ